MNYYVRVEVQGRKPQDLVVEIETTPAEADKLLRQEYRGLEVATKWRQLGIVIQWDAEFGGSQ